LVFELTMTSATGNLGPPIIFQHLKHCPYLHSPRLAG
jgi:hypothetical protein